MARIALIDQEDIDAAASELNWEVCGGADYDTALDTIARERGLPTEAIHEFYQEAF